MPSSHDNLAMRLLEPAHQPGGAGRVALRQGDNQLTYGELADQVARMASGLRSLGIDRNDRVAVLMRDSLEAAVAILGTVHMGAVAVPLSELALPGDIREYLLQSGAVAVITDTALEPTVDESRAEIEAIRVVICVGAAEHPPDNPVARPTVHDYRELLDSVVPASDGAAVTPQQTALLLYSAVSAQHDLRGVPHPHATPLAAFESFARRVVHLDAGDRVFAIARLSTVYGLGMGLFFPLAAGAETLLLPQQPRSDTIFAGLESFQPTVFLATPSVYGQLARDAEAQGADAGALSSCRVCISGAEGMPPQLVPKIRDVLGTTVTVGYGLTEVFQFVFAGTAGEGPVGNVGRLMPGFEARILDDNGAPLGADVIGTLQLRGPTVLSGYWGDHDSEAEGEARRRADGSDDRFEDGWFTTMDRFMKDEHGNYFFCGRADDQFKVGGKWVSPIEVERVLLGHEKVWDCAVIGADDEDGLIKPLAFVVPNIGHDPGPDLEMILREYVKNELAPYKYPRWIEFCDKLPRGPSGKLLRYKLKPPRAKRQAETLEGLEVAQVLDAVEAHEAAEAARQGVEASKADGQPGD